MCKINECRIDLINNKIIVTKKFLNAAGVLNSPEYKILQQARLENPGFTVVLREIKKAEKKNTYRNLSFTNMEMYIRETCGEGKQFPNYRELSVEGAETKDTKPQRSLIAND